jgi:transglutaminase-like putative cysteine protease
MPDTPTPLVPDDEQTRDRLRAGLAVCCAIALVLAGTVVPALSAGGLGQSPLASVVPQPDANPFDQSGGGGGSAPGGLGALNPGDSTSVGGSLGGEDSPFQSQNVETHFTVQSSDPAYWRTGAYDTYTGSGWERSGDRQPYAGPLDGNSLDGGPSDGDGLRGERVEYRVTLAQSATALPSVWRAESVSQTGADSLFVTDQGAFVSDDPLPSGTTYQGVSYSPPQDPAVLKASGWDYPAEIERRYAGLPADADPRIGTFTANLTADADSPYQTATRVESWLEANKNYSLNVSEPGENVASEFVFEMDQGYCEYFATAMTVMLRSQGVPARYVVGYSTGEQVGENTYRVRELNAHAWVEVYFADVGWVKFDPTPGQNRLDAEQDAVENRTGDEYQPTESGSPGEAFSPNESGHETTDSTGPDDATTTAGGGSEAGTTDSGDGSATETSDSGTTASGPPPDSATTADDSGATASDPETTGDGDGGTPEGTTTTADGSGEASGDDGSRADDSDGQPTESPYEVELNRTPVPGATLEVTVLRNGTPATGVPVAFNGRVVGYTDAEGTVAAEVPYEETLRITVHETASDGTAAREATPPLDLGVPMSLDGGPPGPLGLSGQANETNETTSGDEGYSLATNATVAISGDVATGSRVVVIASVEDVPVRDAAVRLDGEPVGATDEDGRIRVRLPDSPGNVTVAVERGAVSGETTVTIPELTVSVESALPLALPGTAVEVRASYGGEPLSNASVAVAGKNAATDLNGTAAATLPFQRSAPVVVAAHGQTRRTTVSGLLINLFALLGGVAVALGGLGWGAYRRGLGPRSLAGLLLAGLRAIPALAVGLLFAVVDCLEWAFRTVSDALGELRAGETTVDELLARLRAWLTDRASAAREGARWPGEEPITDAPATERDDSYRTLREAWHAFLDAVSVRRPAAMTPGEIATHAVREDGLPAGAVATLRDAFRDVEYGARSPADRLARVEAAVETIEQATRESAAEPETSDESADDEPEDDAGGAP